MAQSFLLLTRIRRINRRPDQPDGCLQTGKRCFTKERVFSLLECYGQPVGADHETTRAAPR